MTQDTPYTPHDNPTHTLNTPQTSPKQPPNASSIRQKAITLSQKADECKPLIDGGEDMRAQAATLVKRPHIVVATPGRGLHSSTSQLSLSRFFNDTRLTHPLTPPETS